MPDPPVTAAQTDQQRALEIAADFIMAEPSGAYMQDRDELTKAIVAALSAVRAEQATTDRTRIETLEARLKAYEDGARMDAITDETCVGWYRAMALRFSEDRDEKKHENRTLLTRITTLEQSRDALRQALHDAQDGLEALAMMAKAIDDGHGVNMRSIAKRERLNIERALEADHG